MDAVRLDLAGLCMEVSGIRDARAALLCVLAGPAAGLLWSLLALSLPTLYFQTSGKIGLVISLFNLLPIRPLDGGRLLELWVGTRCAQSVSRLLCIVGAAAAVCMRYPRLLLPCGILFILNLPTERPSAGAAPASPAGRPAPATRPGSSPYRIGSGNDKSGKR